LFFLSASSFLNIKIRGSRTSSSEAFLKAVRPELAVASAGRNNRYKHSHESTIDRFINYEAVFLRTDRDGAVTVTLKDDKYKVSTYSDSRFKKTDNWQDELMNLRLLLRQLKK
jgi:beta-lactamase superfamily II metal-dependent hydrolase